VYGRVVASTTELRGFVREAVGDVYRYALALTVSTARAEQLTTSAAVRLARHVDAVGAAPVSTARLTLVVRREVLDSLPRRRRRRTRSPVTSGDEVIRGSGALAALASLDVDERVALVLRHYDGLLLPDVAAALGVPYPEAEKILNRARARLAGIIEQFDDGAGADPFGRLVRGVPGPPDSLADRVWVTVDKALVPDYANGEPQSWSDAWGGGRLPDAAEGDDPLGWEGFSAVPVDEAHVPPAREARRVGTTLLVGAGALAVVLAVAALTAPRDDAGGGAEATGATVDVVSSVPASPQTTLTPSTTSARVGRGALTPAEPDLRIDVGTVSPHVPDSVETLTDPTVSLPEPPDLANVSASVRSNQGASRVVVRRVNPDGSSDVWLIRVEGQVRAARGDTPELLQAWGIDGGGVVVSLRVAGDPDARVLAGLRAGGGGTWLRLPDGAEPLVARADGSVLCREPAENGQALTTYQVLG
jgi:DNA-directed RNA polymerase specialized sigma24 family protein